MKELLNARNLLIIILIFAAATRLIRLDYPKGYVFDEVYHAFTAKEYTLGHKEAWEYWTSPPAGVAYEWTHPPLAKELMATSMFIFHSTESWAWRLPGVIFGLIGIYFIYLLGKILFKSENIGLLSAFIYSLDGLSFVQSRTGMNDIYVVTFMLGSLILFLQKRFFLSSILLGLALSSKWSAIYLFILYTILIIRYKQFKNILYFIIVPPLIYLISYIPFFQLGHTFKQFKELQQQMWWYHTGLKATHDYASPWWSWPFNLYPVWYFVDYFKDERIANIFASGNQLLLWLGVLAIINSLVEIFKYFKKVILGGLSKINQKDLIAVEPIIILLLGYFVFWLPWAISPRIMFLYHYLLSVPFLCLLLGYQINSQIKSGNIKLVYLTLGLIFVTFVMTFPVLTGLPMTKGYIEFFFNTNLTKNPFG